MTTRSFGLKRLKQAQAGPVEAGPHLECYSEVDAQRNE